MAHGKKTEYGVDVALGTEYKTQVISWIFH